MMERKGSDNIYLHKDFHGALSAAIEYLHRNYGDEAVRDYLRRFTAVFYAPLISDIKRRGLIALKEHFERVYAAEGAPVRIVCSNDELVIDLEACPAVTHMRKQGYPVAALFHETTRTVNEALCDDTPFSAELVEYDPKTGRSIQRFVRRTR